MSANRRLQGARALLAVMPLVMRTVGCAMRESPREAAPLLPQQYRLLGAIGRRPRTLGQVAAIQGVTPATATSLVTTLETRGWVTRTHDLQDRRRVVVTLTDGGAEVLAASQLIAEGAMADLLAPLSDEQLKLLTDGLAVLGDLGAMGTSKERSPL
jgi:DNA-binding MarR family transcriptional regulator